MLDWVSGTPAELTLWGTSSSGMPSFRASSHVYTYHQPKKLLIPYMQLKNPSSFQKAKIDLLLSALTYLTIFFLGNYWKSERSKVLTFPYANASGWAKKLHISSSWFDTGSPVSKRKSSSGASDEHNEQTYWCMLQLMHGTCLYMVVKDAWFPYIPFKKTACWLLMIPMKSQGITRPCSLIINKIRRNPNNLPAGQIFILR